MLIVNTYLWDTETYRSEAKFERNSRTSYFSNTILIQDIKQSFSYCVVLKQHIQIIQNYTFRK